jgi:hypothetical protein
MRDLCIKKARRRYELLAALSPLEELLELVELLSDELLSDELDELLSVEELELDDSLPVLPLADESLFDEPLECP